MPFLAPLGAAIMAGAAAAGTAAVAGISAAGAALGGLTLGGLATGASIVGAGLQVVGAMTGSKTLSNIGMGFSVAGGVAGLPGAVKSLQGAGGIRGLLGNNASKVDGMVGGAKATQNAASKVFDVYPGSAAKAGSTGMNTLKTGASSIADDVAGGMSGDTGKLRGFDPELEKSYFQRASQLTQYNPMMGIMGGMGDAYMINENNQVKKDLLDKEIAFKQQEVDLEKNKFARSVANNSTPLAPYQPTSLVRNPYAYTPLLRGPL